MEQLKIGKTLNCSGCITERKFLAGSVREFERRLGYKPSRLLNGFHIAHLKRIPKPAEFMIKGYTNVATHNFEKQFKNPSNHYVDNLKMMAFKKFELIGATNLIKILPITPHNNYKSDDEQYPPGGGIPQWELIDKLPFTIFQYVEAYHQSLVRLK